MAYIDTEVWVDLSDFDTDDLKEELDKRGELDKLNSDSTHNLVAQIYELFRQQKPYENELRKLFFEQLGRIA